VAYGWNSSYTDNWRPAEQLSCYRIIASTNTGGDSAPSNVRCTALPATPIIITWSSPDAHSIEIAWTDNSAVEDGYEIVRQNGALPSVVFSVAANATSYRDTSIVTGYAYTYYV